MKIKKQPKPAVSAEELQAIADANCKACDGSGWTVEGWERSWSLNLRDPFKGDCKECGGTGKKP